MAESSYPIGSVANGHVLTTEGWILLGTTVNGSVMTPAGWAPATVERPVGVPIGVIVGGALIGIIGVVMANASVSLISGTGTNWTGAAIALIAGIAATLAQVLTKAPLWATLVSGAVGLLLAVVAVGSVVYLEVQLDDRRQEISDLF